MSSHTGGRLLTEQTPKPQKPKVQKPPTGDEINCNDHLKCRLCKSENNIFILDETVAITREEVDDLNKAKIITEAKVKEIVEEINDIIEEIQKLKTNKDEMLAHIHTNNDKITNAQTDIDKNENDIKENKKDLEYITTLKKQIPGINTDIATNEGNIRTVQWKLGEIEKGTTALAAQILKCASDIVKLEEELSNKQGLTQAQIDEIFGNHLEECKGNKVKLEERK